MIGDHQKASGFQRREQLAIHLGAIDVHVRRVVVEEEERDEVEIVHVRRHRVVEGSHDRPQRFSLRGCLIARRKWPWVSRRDRRDSDRKRCRLARQRAQSIRCCSRRRRPYRALSCPGARLRRPEAVPDRGACQPAGPHRCGQAPPGARIVRSRLRGRSEIDAETADNAKCAGGELSRKHFAIITFLRRLKPLALGTNARALSLSLSAQLALTLDDFGRRVARTRPQRTSCTGRAGLTKAA